MSISVTRTSLVYNVSVREYPDVIGFSIFWRINGTCACSLYQAFFPPPLEGLGTRLMKTTFPTLTKEIRTLKHCRSLFIHFVIYSDKGYLVRVLLAVLDHNHHINRSYKQTSTSESTATDEARKKRDNFTKFGDVGQIFGMLFLSKLTKTMTTLWRSRKQYLLSDNIVLCSLAMCREKEEIRLDYNSYTTTSYSRNCEVYKK